MKQALIVFAKVPRPGAVKTRLSPPLTPTEAANLYDAFLHDALVAYREVPADIRLYLVDGPTDAEDFPELEKFYHQAGRGLGEKMSNAFAETFEEGYERACIIGTDHPTLDTRIVKNAFDTLDVHDLAIGPSRDGGYYLLSMSRLHLELFTGMAYSHSRVFAETLERAQQNNIGTKVLEEWYDVDDLESLVHLISDLQENVALLARTRRVVDELLLSYPSLRDVQKSL